MKTIQTFVITICAILLSSLETFSQDERKIKVDPGVSVHNYKHPHKAKKAEELQKIQRRGRYSSRVGIVRRSVTAPRQSYQPSTPKYRQRAGWSIVGSSNPTPTRLNPLTNPGNYKTQR
ncbi:hypothetical protein [Persicitalea jodogahamensis]|uniref:Uncharacterized protein n=1 Tax=Persicitalea jodogahamensis TaxID=402147 RepID=A0A8J3G9E9_9BACT|nr:hypothetical protein [Persicitalea jodogahamensis]GHB65617.1 hypothetical protein GCM10007390_19670 [Persicitalea jodogahamensis]